jgi:WD40 repeat protein
VDCLLRWALVKYRKAGDHERLLLAARSVRYWAQRLETGAAGQVDGELALIPEPDIVALRDVLRRSWHLLSPLGNWRWMGALLLSQMAEIPVLVAFTAQADDLGLPLRLANLWSPHDRGSPVFDRQLDGHAGPVTACILRTDGSWLVACHDQEIRIWDTVNGSHRVIPQGAERMEVLHACAPDSGDWLATIQVRGGVTGLLLHNPVSLRIWDLSTGQVRTLHQSTAGISECRLSPDERWLVSHHEDNEIRFWNTETWQLAGVITEPGEASVSDYWAATRFSPDGSWFALANLDGSIGLWDPATCRRRHVLTGHRAAAAELLAAPDSSWLASAGAGELWIWDARTGTPIRSVRTPTAGCSGLVADPHGRWVAACFGPDSVRVISAEQHPGQSAAASRSRPWVPWLRHGIETARARIFIGAQCVTDRDGRLIVSVSGTDSRSDRGPRAGSAYAVSSWDTATGQRVAGPADRPGEPPSVLIGADGQTAMTIEEGQVEFIDTTTAETIMTIGYRPDRIRTATVRSGLVALGFQSGTVRLLRPGLVRRELRTAEVASSGLHGCFIAPGYGPLLVWTGRRAATLDPATGAVQVRMSGRETGVFATWLPRSCCVASDGSWVATLDDNGTVRVWDPRTGQQTSRASGDNSEEFVLATGGSPNWMATWGAEGQLRIRGASGSVLHDLGNHQGRSQATGYAAADTWLAVEDTSPGTHIWDPLRGRHLGYLPGESGGAALPASPDHPYGLIATITAEGTMKARDPVTGQVHRVSAISPIAGGWAEGARIMAVHPGGDWLAVSDDRGNLAIWPVRQNALLPLASQAGEPYTACLVAPDGATMTTVQRSGVLRVWETMTWQELSAMRVDGPLLDACWASPDRLYAVGAPGAYCFSLIRQQPYPLSR